MSSSGMFSTTGFSTLALSPVDFISNDADVNGKAFLVNIVADGSGESLSGTLNTFTLEGQQTTKPLQVSLIDNFEQCEYPIINKYEYVKEFVIVPKPYTVLSCDSACQSEGAIFNYIPSFSTTCLCVVPQAKAVIGTISDPTLKFKTTFRVNNNDINYQKQLTNVGGVSSSYIGVDGNRDVFVKWTGNMDTGRNCPTASGNNVGAIYNANAGGWKIVSSSLLNNNKVDYDTAVQCFNNINANGAQSYTNAKAYLDQCIAIHQSKVNKMTSTVEFKDVGGTSAVTVGAVDSGKIDLEITNPIQFPTFQMKIKADKLGVVVPVGSPKINAISSQEFYTGGIGNIAVQVRNDGSAQSNFDIFATCDAGFKQSSINVRGQLAPQGIRDFYLPITGATVADFQNGICTVTVKDLNSLNSDTETVSVKVNSLKFCSSNELSCDQMTKDQIQCNSAGTGWTIVEKQSKECGYVPPVCIGLDCPKQTPEFSWGIFIFSAIVGLIVGGVVYGYTTGIELIRTGNEFIDKSMKLVRMTLVIGAIIIVTILVASIVKGFIGWFSI